MHFSVHIARYNYVPACSSAHTALYKSSITDLQKIKRTVNESCVVDFCLELSYGMHVLYLKDDVVSGMATYAYKCNIVF